MSEAPETRTTLSPRTGTKVCILVAIPLLVLGFYFLFSPITEVRTDSGGVFACGNAVSPPSEAFQKGVCQSINRQYQFKGGAAVLAAALIVVVGSSFFGAERRIETARPRDVRE